MLYWCRSAREQALWFVRNVPYDPDALPPVLDLEWNHHSRSCPQNATPEVALAKVKIILEVMESYTGKRPIIYTDVAFHRDVLEGELGGYNFWLRSVAAEPHEIFREPALAVLAIHHHRPRAGRPGSGRPQRVQRHARRMASDAAGAGAAALCSGRELSGRSRGLRPHAWADNRPALRL